MFKERFRSKLNFLNKNGEFSLRNENQVVKADPIKLHNYSSISSRKMREEPCLFSKAKKSPSHFPNIGKYVPYTLNDYKNSKPSEYFQFGGLGSCSIGNKEWKIKNSLYYKRCEYGNNANCSNLLRGSHESLDSLKRKYKRSISHRRYASNLEKKMI